MKSLVLIVTLGLALGACTVRSDTVVQRPAPVAASSTTYVSPDPASPTGTSSTTVYRN